MKIREKVKLYADMTAEEKQAADARREMSNAFLKSRAELIMEEFDSLPPKLREKVRNSDRGILSPSMLFSIDT